MEIAIGLQIETFNTISNKESLEYNILYFLKEVRTEHHFYKKNQIIYLPCRTANQNFLKQFST